jgi:hypothetical protein
VELKGLVSSFRSRLYKMGVEEPLLSRRSPETPQLVGPALETALVFPTEATNIVVPAGYMSTWLTGGRPSK